MSSPINDSPRARDVEFTADTMVVHLEDGRSVSVPLEWFPKLRDASPTQRADWHLIGSGIGIRWEALDEDLSVRGLLVPEGSALRFKRGA